MCQNDLQVSLGFTSKKVPVGTHMCLIFTEEEERVDSLLTFLLSGLKTGERTVCFSEKIDEETLREFFSKRNISYDERKQNKAISLAGASKVYFQDGVFDPDRTLKIMSNFYEESLKLGFPASRVIGEMLPEVQNIPGGDRLLEYESRLSILLRDHPVTTVCQYDVNLFDGATIMDVLKVHPQMIVNGAVVQNPVFIQPEEYLQKRS